MSLIEKIASVVEGALIRHGITEFEGTLDDAQAALTAIMGEGDGVQQCDREAAADQWARLFCDADANPQIEAAIRAGALDGANEVQAFARHRSTAAAAERARIVALLDGIDRTEIENNGWWETSYGAEFGGRILRKIERGEASLDRRNASYEDDGSRDAAGESRLNKKGIPE